VSKEEIEKAGSSQYKIRLVLKLIKRKITPKSTNECAFLR